MIRRERHSEPRPEGVPPPNRRIGGRPSRSVPLLKGLVAVMLLLNVVLLHAIFLSARGVHGYRLQQAQVASLSNTVRRLAQDNHRLALRIRHLKADTAAQERLVKQELGWVREDEIIVEFATPLNP